MAKTITFFSLKGGVGKTAILLNLGMYLALLGRRVLIIDCDPRCSATEAFLHFGKYISDQNMPGTSIYELLQPVLVGRSKNADFKEADLLQARSELPLFLLRGDLQLWSAENYLANAWDRAVTESVSDKIRFLAFRRLVSGLASEYFYDYVLVDTAPSGSYITRTVLLACDGFFLPTTPDPIGEKSVAFSMELVWKWVQRYAEIVRTFVPFGIEAPPGEPIFLGAILGKVHRRGEKPTTADLEWKKKIAVTLESKCRAHPEICSDFVKSQNLFVAELPLSISYQSSRFLVDFWEHHFTIFSSSLIEEYLRQMERIAEVLP